MSDTEGEETQLVGGSAKMSERSCSFQFGMPEFWVYTETYIEKAPAIQAKKNKYNVEEVIFAKILWRYGLFAFLHFSTAIVAIVFMSYISNLSLKMTLDVYTNQVIPVGTIDPTLSVIDQVFQQIEVVRGSYPLLVGIPVYHGVYFAFYFYYCWRWSDLRKSYKHYRNSSRYFPAIIAEIFIGFQILVLTGSRDILGWLMWAGIVVCVNLLALITDELATLPLGSCTQSCFTIVEMTETGSPEAEPAKVAKLALKLAQATATMNYDKAAGCAKGHWMDPKHMCTLRSWALNFFGFLATILVVVLITQICLSYNELPQWVQALSLETTIFFALAAMVYAWKAQSTFQKKRRTDARNYFYWCEQAAQWAGFVQPVVFTIVLMYKVNKSYAN